MQPRSISHRIPIVVLISGRGSNLQAIIDQAKCDLPVEIRAVISNRPDVFGLERAHQAGIPTHVVDHRKFGDRSDFDEELMAVIDQYAPELVVLAGFMRILGNGFVAHYRGRMLNIHPSLLPSYRGLNTHQRALTDGDAVHGASVHFVTNELDGGPVIIQAPVPILPGDDVEKLSARVRKEEHVIYPLVIRWFAEGRLRLTGNKVIMDGRTLTAPINYAEIIHERQASQ